MGYGLIRSGYSKVVIDKHETLTVCGLQLLSIQGFDPDDSQGLCGLNLLRKFLLISNDMELVWGRSWNLGKSLIR